MVLVLGCTSSKAPVTDDFSALSGQDEKSDAFSYRMKIVGSLDYGQTSTPVRYTSSPRYRAFKFGGSEGDRVDVWVQSTDGGDAVAWVLDNGFHTLGSNDDASDSTLDAHVRLTLSASSSNTHYIVFRDYDLYASHYTVALTAHTAAPACQVDADCASTSVADGEVAECGNANTCEAVAIADVHCGGFIMNAHQCPDGYTCQLLPGTPDTGGSCVAQP